MVSTPTLLGPFKKGMNNRSSQETIADDELSHIENFELDADGSLVTRPAIAPAASTPVAGQFVNPLGFYVTQDGTTFLVATTNAATWLMNTATNLWTQIWGQRASGFAQYDHKAVLSRANGAGGYWDGSTFVSTPTMPACEQIVFYQERFWAFGVKGSPDQTRVWFSNITSAGPSPTTIWTWTVATDFFEVGPGDGQWITGLMADSNALIIFRNRSTWHFSYPTSPFTGTLRELNPVVGADNKWCFVRYESAYYVLSQGFLYQFVNFQFYPLNSKRIDFQSTVLSGGQRLDLRLSVFGQRIIVYYLGTLYVYGVATDSWCVWRSTTMAAHFLQLPASSTSGDDREALVVSGSGNSARTGLYRIIDGVLPVGDGEKFNAFIRTKSYSFEEAAQYKRIFYWAAEVQSASGAEGIAYPSTVSASGTTWNQMNESTWNDLEGGSWNNPLTVVPVFRDDVEFPAFAPTRALIRFASEFHFMRVAFEVYLECDGTARTAMARIFSITPYLAVRGPVAGKVT